MKANEIKVGGLYTAKVSGRLTTVRVDAIRNWESSLRSGRNGRDTYDVTNLVTGRKTTFRSAAKFRGVAETPEQRQMRLEAALAEQDARTLAMPEAAGMTPETGVHIRGSSDGFVEREGTPTEKCWCVQCRIVRAMQRQAARLAAENPYREGW